jgi:hypothetical protein
MAIRGVDTHAFEFWGTDGQDAFRGNFIVCMVELVSSNETGMEKVHGQKSCLKPLVDEASRSENPRRWPPSIYR